MMESTLLLLMLLPFFLSIPAVPIEPPVLPCPDVDGNYDQQGLTRIPPHRTDCGIVHILNLRANSIQNIPPGALRGYVHLVRLCVSDNQLRNVEKGAFNDAGQLAVVDLSYNFIQSLNQSFHNSESLMTVDLKHNWIQSLDCNTFSGANNIHFIDLSFNEISDIDNTTFSGHPELRTINLAHNRIRVLDKFLFVSSTELVTLKLHNNRLSFLDHRQFETLTYLEDLYLNDNPLSSIYLQFSGSFIFLHAGNCDLTELPAIKFSGPGRAGIIEMDLRDNMVDCNCTNLEMNVSSNRVLQCVDEVTRIRSTAICVNDVTTVSSSTSGDKDVTTVSNALSGENEPLEGIGVHTAHHRSLTYIILAVIVGKIV